VHWGTNQVLFIGPDTEFSREDFVTADFSVATHAATTSQLVFKLVGRGDSLLTAQELQSQTDPLNPDSDGDGLKDGEIAQHLTDSLNSDSDGDGQIDGFEILGGMNPLDPDSVMRLGTIQRSGASAVELTWAGETNQTYRVHRATNLGGREFDTLTNGLPGIQPNSRFI
jgi:hypothetical protein